MVNEQNMNNKFVITSVAFESRGAPYGKKGRYLTSVEGTEVMLCNQMIKINFTL
jgi:hypothetical protein